MILRKLHSNPGGINLDRSRGFHDVFHTFERHPAAAVARKGPTIDSKVDELLNACRVQHRNDRVDEGELALVTRGRGFAGMIIAGEQQHAAKRRGTGQIAMAQGVARAIHPRTLRIPHGKHAGVLAGPCSPVCWLPHTAVAARSSLMAG